MATRQVDNSNPDLADIAHTLSNSAASAASDHEIGNALENTDSTNSSRPIRILVTGRTGSGISVLVRGLTGLKVPSEHLIIGFEGYGRPLKKIVRYEAELNNGVSVLVWDSPGILDGTGNQDKYFREIREKCSERDLTIFCISVTATRFVHTEQNPDVVAMRQLTEALGQEFWKDCVIALTFANVIEGIDLFTATRSPQERVDFFKGRIERWRKQIVKILIKDLRLPDDILSSVRMFPTGHCEIPHLPDSQHWLSSFWWNCIPAVSSPEVRGAMEKADMTQIIFEKEVPELTSFQRNQVASVPFPLLRFMQRRLAGAFCRLKSFMYRAHPLVICSILLLGAGTLWWFQNLRAE